MANNFVAPGDVIEVSSATARSSGAAFRIGDILGVAMVDIPANGKGSAGIAGIFELPKLSAGVFTAGAKLNWDASANNLTVAAVSGAGDVTNCGVCMADAGSGVTIARVKLNAFSGTGS